MWWPVRVGWEEDEDQERQSTRAEHLHQSGQCWSDHWGQASDRQLQLGEAGVEDGEVGEELRGGGGEGEEGEQELLLAEWWDTSGGVAGDTPPDTETSHQAHNQSQGQTESQDGDTGLVGEHSGGGGAGDWHLTQVTSWYGGQWVTQVEEEAGQGETHWQEERQEKEERSQPPTLLDKMFLPGCQTSD